MPIIFLLKTVHYLMRLEPNGKKSSKTVESRFGHLRVPIRVTLFYKKSKAKNGDVIFPFLRP